MLFYHYCINSYLNQHHKHYVIVAISNESVQIKTSYSKNSRLADISHSIHSKFNDFP